MLLALLAADEGEVVNPVLPAWNEMLYGGIFFTILYILVRFVFLPSAKRAMNDRAATIRADLDAADAAKSRAVNASAEAEDQLAGVRAEAASIIDAARTEADAERERLIGRAEREVAAMREIAESEVEREKAEAVSAMQPQVINLAASAASKVIDRQVDINAAQPVVNRFLNNPN